MSATRTPSTARKSWLNRLTGIFGRPAADRSPPAPNRRLSVEGLEDRMCPTGIDVQTALAIENYFGVGTAVSVLHNQLMNDAKQLGYDVLAAEAAKATPQGSAIALDALQLYVDAYYGSAGTMSNSGKVFSDVITLGQQMEQELSAAGVNSLMASNSKVVSETGGVLSDVDTNIQFIVDNNCFLGPNNAVALSTATDWAELGFTLPATPTTSTTPTGTGSTAPAPTPYATATAVQVALSPSGPMGEFQEGGL